MLKVKPLFECHTQKRIMYLFIKQLHSSFT
jgi:hypothetical protein